MSKSAPMYGCSNCDAQFLKWAGRCTECGAWGSLKESGGDAEGTKPETGRVAGKPQTPIPFTQETTVKADVRATGLGSLDGVLGGGLVDGSVTLIAGEPGIGKSTLLAQAALAAAATGRRIVYVTGEESPMQVRRRLERLSKTLPSSLAFVNHTDAGILAATIEEVKPDLTIIDSVQTLRSNHVAGEPGGASQVKASGAQITEAAKRAHVSVILVGQVTKDGDIAGPRVLEHLVDTVLFLEGDRGHRFRLLRALKHRFGPTDEVAVLAMTELGLEPVEDPSSELLRDRAQGISGSAITCLIEGHRPLLLEIQSLVSPAGYGTPVRRTTGTDTARLGMLLAVLARRSGIFALDKDVYANAAGGMDARDPSMDLAICLAIASAVKDTPLDPRLGVFGEVGLAGELRPVGLPELRLKELGRMGFATAIVPRGQSKGAPKGMEVKEAGTVREALQIARVL
jgi:DNA repair protein RadA/Sms